MEYKTGNSLCGCTLRQKCGFGAYGEVWLAEDSIGTRVALKIIYNRGSYSERELAGLKNYKDCNHPNLLKIRYVEITDERICCIMDAADDLNRGNGEYLPDTLANRLNKFGRMDGKEIVAMLDGLLNGLEELHKHGLVHRDIKPDNILWVNGRPTLADVGLIALDGKGSLVGTPGFMSPKLLSGKGQADTSDDFYALGKVIYCALTGLPVGEYPSIPENMTISMDASLGRALRESCKKPVRSSAEFRRLLQGKKQTGSKFPNREILFIPIAFILFAGVLLLWMRHPVPETTLPTVGKTPVAKPAPPAAVKKTSAENQLLSGTKKNAEEDAGKAAERTEAQGQLKMSLAQRRKQEIQFMNSLHRQIVTVLRKANFLPGDGSLCEKLLTYKGMWHPKMTVREHSEIFALGLEYSRSISKKTYTARQDYWRGRKLSAQDMQREMLETDRVMQAFALDILIRKIVDRNPRYDKITKEIKTQSGRLKRVIFYQEHSLKSEDKASLETLLRLRDEACDPSIYRYNALKKRIIELSKPGSQQRASADIFQQDKLPSAPGPAIRPQYHRQENRFAE